MSPTKQNRIALFATAVRALTFGGVALFAMACSSGSSDEVVDGGEETADEDVPEDVGMSADDGVGGADQGDEGGSTDGCETALTVAEIDEIFGTSVQSTNGAGKFCNIVFADDSVGIFSVFPSEDADEGLASLASQLEEANTSGELLEDGARGYILGRSAVVLGDSGRLFRFDLPDNAEVSELATAMRQLADVLLAR